MGSYENIVKIEEMRRKMDEGDALSAQKILDTMELKKIKNMIDLNLMAEVYNENERYDEAAQLYLKIYEKTKSRKSLFQLTDISINRNNVEDAQNYLMQYQRIAPKDYNKYVFRYRIDKLKGEPYEQLIETLVTLKNTEYTEKWAYELAKTYYKAGMEAECIRECSDIILWFGEGMFVEKAKMLRAYYSGETDKARIMEELKRRASINSSTYEVENLTEEADLNDDNTEDDVTNDTDYYDADLDNVNLDNVNLDNADLDNADLDNADLDYAGSIDTNLHNIYLNENDSNKNGDQVMKENGNFYDEFSRDNEEALYPSSEYISEEEETEFEFGLKKEVQDILTEVWEEEQPYQEDQQYEEELTSEEEQTYQEDTFEEVYHKEEDSVLPELMKDESSYVEPVLSENEKAEQEVEDTIYKLLEEEDMDEEDKKLSQIAEEYMLNPEEIFGNFFHVSTVKKQIVKGLEGILEDPKKTVYMIITGTVGSGKTTLAKDITLFLNKSGKLKSSKIAKIKADKLNSIDVMSKKETLKDCCVVVENASELKRKTIDSLLELSQNLQGNIAVIFEENKKNMNKLFRECPKLMDLFKNRIHLPQYTQEDLIGFAYACLKQQAYHLSPKAETILLNKINQIAKQIEPQRQLEHINNLMQTAMNAADIRMGKQLSELATLGRLQEVEILSVLPEDFSFKL